MGGLNCVHASSAPVSVTVHPAKGAPFAVHRSEQPWCEASRHSSNASRHSTRASPRVHDVCVRLPSRVAVRLRQDVLLAWLLPTYCNPALHPAPSPFILSHPHLGDQVGPQRSQQVGPLFGEVGIHDHLEDLSNLRVWAVACGRLLQKPIRVAPLAVWAVECGTQQSACQT
eukprot:352541-Chlamydomonas_euryale.AAC.3